MSAALAFDAVTAARGGQKLFERLSFALGPGETLRVCGANGAGKSSLVRIAAGLLRPLAGHAVREGRIALLAEGAALDDDRSVRDALRFWAGLDGADETMVDAALDDVALAHLAPVPVRHLSTGQQRRVAMARVLTSGAPIWLLDEPANGLDGEAVTRLEHLIARHRDAGGIALVTTHQPIALDDAREIAL